MNLRTLLFIVGIAVAPSMLAQDTIRTITERKAGFRVLFNFDFRRTFVNTESVRFYGFRLGAQRDKDIIALGFYGLGDPYVQPSVDLGELGAREVVTHFDFATLTYERILLDSKRWQIGVPLSIGLGNYRKSYREPDGSLIAYSTNELVPIELSLHTDYNLFWWLFIGVGGGYRYVLAADHQTTIVLSDWTYYFKAGIRVGEMIKRVKREFKKEHGS
ncbi:MAG: hypothetical protein ABI432_02980 [Flavobacteriales bacterium]